MTMHLAQGLTTTRTSKPKRKKLTNAQRERLEQDHKNYNKRMRQLGCHKEQMSFNDYIDYVHGVYKPKTQSKPFVEYTPAQSFRRETTHIPSHGHGIGVATKAKPNVYTGTLIKGIATMHKSNAVPIIDDQQAIDIAHMRR